MSNRLPATTHRVLASKFLTVLVPKSLIFDCKRLSRQSILRIGFSHKGTFLFLPTYPEIPR